MKTAFLFKGVCAKIILVYRNLSNLRNKENKDGKDISFWT